MTPAKLVCSSERLQVRHMVDTDAAFILELLNDPDFIRNIADRGVRTLEDARKYIATGPAASYARFGFGLSRVELRDGAIPIGICGLLRRDTHPDVEIGFAYLAAFRGKGYALEAAAAVLKFGTRSLRLDRIVALTAPDNNASMKVLEKLGFEFQGMLHLQEFARASRLFALEVKNARQLEPDRLTPSA